MIPITMIDATAARENFLLRKRATKHEIHFLGRAHEMILFFTRITARTRTQKRERAKRAVY